jgi:hypothetical protein
MPAILPRQSPTGELIIKPGRLIYSMSGECGGGRLACRRAGRQPAMQKSQKTQFRAIKFSQKLNIFKLNASNAS